ncbi:hypothetical protein PI172_0319 [Prevotella intermedia]|uniref:Uncharacterized protein n=1 Tax=Prevotella intermedia TaxID=28131 RepID=A0AAD1F6G8_PREIN|nr:hypothetical protein PI172_0319 [Prevotella intermedia]
MLMKNVYTIIVCFSPTQQALQARQNKNLKCLPYSERQD